MPDDVPMRRLREGDDLESVFGSHPSSPVVGPPAPTPPAGAATPASTPLPAAAPDATAVRAPGARPADLVGRWSFLVALVAAVIALIRIPNFTVSLAFVPAVVAVVLGLIALCLPRRPRGYALLGIAITVVAVGSATLITFAALGGFDGAQALGAATGF